MAFSRLQPEQPTSTRRSSGNPARALDPTGPLSTVRPRFQLDRLGEQHLVFDVHVTLQIFVEPTELLRAVKARSSDFQTRALGDESANRPQAVERLEVPAGGRRDFQNRPDKLGGFWRQQS